MLGVGVLVSLLGSTGGVRGFRVGWAVVWVGLRVRRVFWLFIVVVFVAGGLLFVIGIIVAVWRMTRSVIGRAFLCLVFTLVSFN